MQFGGEDQEPLFNFISKLGHIVKNLSLNLSLDSWNGDGWSRAETEDFNTRVLGHCSTLRRLAIFHESVDKSNPQLLLDNMRNLSSLEEIQIIEEGELAFSVDIPASDAPNYLAHRLLDVVLDACASHLRTIILLGVTPLSIATFEKIQHKTPKLNRLDMTRGLEVHHHESLATPIAWACAANLQHVSLTRCRGAHAAIFTRQLAAGAIGHLRTLHMSMCGEISDEETMPVATKWTIPALEVLELDDFEWKTGHFFIIHARKVFLEGVWRLDRTHARALIAAMTDTATFPGAIELHVTYVWSHQDLNDLRVACFTRDIKIVERDWEFEQTEEYSPSLVLPLNLYP